MRSRIGVLFLCSCRLKLRPAFKPKVVPRLFFDLPEQPSEQQRVRVFRSGAWLVQGKCTKSVPGSTSGVPSPHHVVLSISEPWIFPTAYYLALFRLPPWEEDSGHSKIHYALLFFYIVSEVISVFCLFLVEYSRWWELFVLYVCVFYLVVAAMWEYGCCHWGD